MYDCPPKLWPCCILSHSKWSGMREKLYSLSLKPWRPGLPLAKLTLKSLVVAHCLRLLMKLFVLVTTLLIRPPYLIVIQHFSQNKDVSFILDSWLRTQPLVCPFTALWLLVDLLWVFVHLVDKQSVTLLVYWFFCSLWYYPYKYRWDKIHSMKIGYTHNTELLPWAKTINPRVKWPE